MQRAPDGDGPGISRSYDAVEQILLVLSFDHLILIFLFIDILFAEISTAAKTAPDGLDRISPERKPDLTKPRPRPRRSNDIPSAKHQRLYLNAQLELCTLRYRLRTAHHIIRPYTTPSYDSHLHKRPSKVSSPITASFHGQCFVLAYRYLLYELSNPNDLLCISRPRR
jgi:hypothetical protein